MKRLIISIILWIAVFSPVSAQPQSRFGNCRPGYIDLTIGGTFFTHIPMQCIDISFDSQQGYFPVGQSVAFDYLTKSYTGSVIGYQWIWKPTNEVVVQYLIYVPSLSYELNINVEEVRAI